MKRKTKILNILEKTSVFLACYICNNSMFLHVAGIIPSRRFKGKTAIKTNRVQICFSYLNL